MDKKILDFIFQSGGIGLEFYNPAEYMDIGVFYTIIDADDKHIDIKYNQKEDEYYDVIPWYRFLSDLESGFYVIKNTDFLYQSMGVDIDLSIDDVFGHLNEETYQPILNLRFDPPLRDEWELLEVMKIIQRNYPNFTWKSGEYPTHLPDLDDLWEGGWEGIWYVTIGYFKSHPESITYTNGDVDDPSMPDDEHHMYKHLDGRQWVRSHEFDADETSAMFGPLIETDEFDWVGDIIDDDNVNRFSKIPAYNGKRYILLFSRPMYYNDILDLLKFLGEIGWTVGDNIKDDYNIEEISEYTSNGTGYIHLRPSGSVTYADDINSFRDYNNIDVKRVEQILI